jgi:glucose-1-phosphate thymidylyltransferase
MDEELVGVLPAAGRGTRLGPIPCSKEIMPLGFQPQADAAVAWQPVTAIELHLEALRRAGVRRVVVIIGETKADVVRYVGDGSRYGVSVAYVYQQQLRGMPFALNLARPWVGQATTLFSMPDTLVTPPDIMARLAEEHRHRAADVTLGLFPTATPQKFGMVGRDPSGRITAFVDKPAQTELTLMWGLAAWSPRFADFLAADLAARPAASPELVLSDVFLAALRAGLAIHGVVLDEARYHDIGTPEDFQAVVLSLALRQQRG